MDESSCLVHFLAVPGHCIIQVWIFSKLLHFRQERLYSLLHRGWQQRAVSCYKQLCRGQRVVDGGVEEGGMLRRGVGTVQRQNQLSRNRKGGRKKLLPNTS